VAFGDETYELNLTNYDYKYDIYTRNMVGIAFAGVFAIVYCCLVANGTFK
jgi:archaellum biogenesis protein FlaJ (TadC family)